jgi:hypothetical protein
VEMSRRCGARTVSDGTAVCRGARSGSSRDRDHSECAGSDDHVVPGGVAAGGALRPFGRGGRGRHRHQVPRGPTTTASQRVSHGQQQMLEEEEIPEEIDPAEDAVASSDPVSEVHAVRHQALMRELLQRARAAAAAATRVGRPRPKSAGARRGGSGGGGGEGGSSGGSRGGSRGGGRGVQWQRAGGGGGDGKKGRDMMSARCNMGAQGDGSLGPGQPAGYPRHWQPPEQQRRPHSAASSSWHQPRRQPASVVVHSPALRPTASAVSSQAARWMMPARDNPLLLRAHGGVTARLSHAHGCPPQPRLPPPTASANRRSSHDGVAGLPSVATGSQDCLQ